MHACMSRCLPTPSRNLLTSKILAIAVIHQPPCPAQGHLEFEAEGPTWVKYSGLYHSPEAIRAQMGVCSLDTLGIFFASVETNIACAAGGNEVWRIFRPGISSSFPVSCSPSLWAPPYQLLAPKAATITS